MKRLVPLIAMMLKVRQRLEAIKDRLELTPEQIEEVRPLLMEEAKKLRAVREAYDGDDQNIRQRMARDLRGVQNATDELLQTILSQKQMEEVEKIREEGRQRIRERAGLN